MSGMKKEKMAVTVESKSGTEFMQVEGLKAEGPYSTAKVSVWWDLENFGAGKMSDPHLMPDYIHSALAKMGYSGPVSTFAYGNSKLIDNSLHQALSSTGITFVDVPEGTRSIDRVMSEDMMFWAWDNPIPASLMLICGDESLLRTQTLLMMRNYKILLARLLPHTTNADADADAGADGS